MILNTTYVWGIIKGRGKKVCNMATQMLREFFFFFLSFEKILLVILIKCHFLLFLDLYPLIFI